MPATHPPSAPWLPCLRRAKMDGPYDSRVLPVVLTVVMMSFLSAVWIGTIISYGGGP